MNQKNEQGDARIRLNAHFIIQRKREKSKEPSQQTASFTRDIIPNKGSEWDKLAKALKVKAGSSSEVVDIPNLLPFFLIVPNEGEIKPADFLFEPALRRKDKDSPIPAEEEAYSTMSLSLQKRNDAEETMVWNMQAKSNEYMKLYKDIMGFDPVKYDPESNSSYIETIIFVDKVFPDYLVKYAQGG